jgi:Adenylate and Guanylate cyclase catalytic domain
MAFFAEFASVVDAVECAAILQRGMAQRNSKLPVVERIDIRIGVHVGDVIVEDGDRHGDAVNVAARLQQLADPGGICVSRSVMDHVKHKVALAFELRGEERLKNIAEPVSVFRVRLDSTQARFLPPLPDKPSIAVLPFENLSGDSEQEYFADGMVEEIITALSRFRGLFVIAPTARVPHCQRQGSTQSQRQDRCLLLSDPHACSGRGCATQTSRRGQSRVAAQPMPGCGGERYQAESASVDCGATAIRRPRLQFRPAHAQVGAGGCPATLGGDARQRGLEKIATAVATQLHRTRQY